MRERKKFSQELTASALGVKRTTLNNYENGYAEPNLQLLVAFSEFYRISVDTLINVDLSIRSENQLAELESGNDSYMKGTKLRVLATTIDSTNKENIELVNIKAKAGYTQGYNDPEFVRTLPTFQLPFLSTEKKYRTFQIDGDSMHPIPHNSYITAEFVSNWHEVKDGHAYIVLTLNEGIVFKVLYNHARSKKKFLLHSLNKAYKPYEVAISDIKEIWKFVYYSSPELPEPIIEKDELVNSVANLQQDVYKLIDRVEASMDTK